MLLTLLLPLASACAKPAHGGAPMVPSAEAPVAVLPSPLHPGPYAVGVTTRTFERRSSTTGELQALDTVIWYPAAEGTRLEGPDARLRATPGAPVAAGGPFPVLVFSHGANSSPIQSTFLTAHLASHGFAVAAPPHPGSTIFDCLGCGSAERQQAMIDDSAANRPDEMSFTLDMLAVMNADAASPFYGAFDTWRAGALGHSWGGYAAAMAATRDERFRVSVAMAPVVNETLLMAIRRLRAPTLVMGSRLDDITPPAWHERLFAALPAGLPRVRLTFPLGGHVAYSDVCPDMAPGCRPGEVGARAYPLVNAYTVAFLRAHLLGDERYIGLLDGRAGGADVELARGE